MKLKILNAGVKSFMKWTPGLIFFCFAQGSLNLAICTDPNQPLIASTSVSQSDIDQQEMRVTQTRDKLALALEAVSG